MANKAIKYRLYPTSEQCVFFAKTFGCCRKVYNLMLADKIAYYQSTGKKLTNTPAMYKKDYPYLKEADSLALANEQLHLQSAYNNFFRDKRIGFPKFKSAKRSRKSYTTNNRCRDNRFYKLRKPFDQKSYRSFDKTSHQHRAYYNRIAVICTYSTENSNKCKTDSHYYRQSGSYLP